MSEVKYYRDERVAGAIATGLRSRGIGVLTVPDAGALGAADDVQLARALAEQRVFFTRDADFLSLVGQAQTHAGLVYTPRQTSIGYTIRRLLLIHQVYTAEDMIGKIEYI